MKEFMNSVKAITEDMSEGRLNSDIIKNLPQERLDRSGYILTFNFDIMGMNSIDKINTVLLVGLMLGVFFIYGASGLIVLYGILTLGTLWSAYTMYRRRKVMIDEEYPYHKIVQNGDYEIKSPYIVAKSEEAKSKFKQLILYSHYLYDDVLYDSLKNSMASFTTSMAILVLVTCFIVFHTPSFAVAIAFNVYFASRFLYEVVRLKYTRLMVGIVADLNEAANEDDEEIKEP